MNVSVQTLLDAAFSPLGYKGIDGSCDNSIFKYLGSTIQYSTVPFYIPTSNAQGFQFLHVLANNCCCVCVFVCVCVCWWGRGVVAILMGLCLIMDLMSIFLMISDVEHLFMYFLAVCILFGELSIQVLCPFLN